MSDNALKNKDSFRKIAGLENSVGSIIGSYNNGNWDAAFSWGDHSLAGYALSSSLKTVATSGLASDVSYNTTTVSASLDSKFDSTTGKATQATAEGGTDDTQWMSPLKTLQSIQANAFFCAGSVKDQLDALYFNDSNPQHGFLTRASDTRIEISIPWFKKGYFQTYRFINDDASFDDAGAGWNRPFILSLIRNKFVESRQPIPTTGLTTSVAFVDTGTYSYIEGIGNTAEVTFDDATQLDFYLTKHPGGGIVKITINGGSEAINNLPKDGNGDVLYDTYAATAAGENVTITTDLPSGVPVTLKFEIVGQNASSTGTRLYLRDDFAVWRFYGYTGEAPVFRTTYLELLRPASSVTEYAIAFRPSAATGATTPFVGGSHGGEDNIEQSIYINGILTPLSDIKVGSESRVVNFSLVQKNNVYHNSDLVNPAATVTHTHNVGSRGLQQSYTWEWLEDVVLANGYSQMWVCTGGNSGGDPLSPNNWAHRAYFRGFDTYNIQTGGQVDYGHVLTDEVVMYSPEGVGTGEGLGEIACVVRFGDLKRSFDGFKNPLSFEDAVWINSRDNLRKIYLQPFRYTSAVNGDKFSGLMTVNFYRKPDLDKQIGIY